MNHVLAMPLIDPGRNRIEMIAPEGSTVAEIVAMALPGATDGQIARTEVRLVNPEGASVIMAREYWCRIRPRAGVRIIIRVVPAGNNLGTLLQVAVAVAAIALGQYYAVPLTIGGLTIPGNVVGAVITATTLLVGGLLIAGLIRPPSQREQQDRPTFTLAGWQNQADPNGTVPCGLGRIRRAPKYAALPYREVVGENIYLRALFLVDYGECAISDIRIGDTPISKFNDVEIEIREGLDSDDPITLYPEQVIESPEGPELDFPFPRDEFGNPNRALPAIPQPEVRVSAPDAERLSIIISFPYGLGWVDTKQLKQPFTVGFRIRARLLGAAEWVVVNASLNITAALPGTAFFRQFTWTPPTRGRYEIEILRLTEETTSPVGQSKSFWVALQSLRPEYPVNFDKPLALIAVRIRATSQLQGTLDSLNCIGERVCLDWDHDAEEWVKRATSNPASLYRFALQGPMSAYPKTDAEIDLEALQDWHDFCRIKGLEYNRLHAEDASQEDVLTAIAAAGRASPWHSGTKESIVIDRPQALVIEEINARNSYGLSWTHPYLRRPDAYRVQFFDETNDWKQGERLIPWPGFAGNIDVTEEIQLPGKTSPDEIWIETRRRQYELERRLTRYQVTMDGYKRSAVRGDRVRASFWEIDSRVSSARVSHVTGNNIAIDDLVEIGENYAIEFRVFANDEDAVGSSTTRLVTTAPGETPLITVSGSGALPAPGDIIHIGPATMVSKDLRVLAIEAGNDGSSVLTLLPSAPEIDDLTDAEVPPAWDGRVGDIFVPADVAPNVPRFTRIVTGPNIDGDNPNDIIVSVAPTGSIPVFSYDIRHSPAGAGTWTVIDDIPAAAAGAIITGYDNGDDVDLQVRALSSGGLESDWSATTTITAGLAPVPNVDVFTVVRLSSGDRLYSASMEDTTGIAGYRIRALFGIDQDPPLTWDDLTPLHTGILTELPWQTSQPSTTGEHTFGIVAVTTDGRESTVPFLIEADVGSPSAGNVILERLETDEVWPGARDNCSLLIGGAVPLGTLVADDTALPFTYTYDIDLGEDRDLRIDISVSGVNITPSYEFRFGTDSDGEAVGSFAALSNVTARYLQLRVTGTPGGGTGTPAINQISTTIYET